MNLLTTHGTDIKYTKARHLELTICSLHGDEKEGQTAYVLTFEQTMFKFDAI